MKLQWYLMLLYWNHSSFKDNDLLHLSPNLVMFQQLRSIELIPQDINFVTVNFDIFPKRFEVHKIYSHCLKDKHEINCTQSYCWETCDDTDHYQYSIENLDDTVNCKLFIVIIIICSSFCLYREWDWIIKKILYFIAHVNKYIMVIA